jgi:hypothetical protein
MSYGRSCCLYVRDGRCLESKNFGGAHPWSSSQDTSRSILNRRESCLAGCMSVVDKARRADGCLDFAITADLIDPGRVNLFER